jgi:twitching motility protein PilT
MQVNDLLKLAVEIGASDLHLKVGSYPMLRVRGLLAPAVSDKRLDHEDMIAIAAAVLPTQYREKFKEQHEVDLAYSVNGLGRFRCNAFQQRGTVGMTFRIIPMKASTIEDLALPPVLKQIAAEERGLVLVTGTTGSGKSTTLAAMIEEINATRTAHIMTIEDPIEHLHRDNKSLINQREVGADVLSFGQALRSALRQDPDVILLGEMRDFETFETALLAAETGHLVLSTLHTLDATETVNRIVSVFPPHQQKQVRIQLASVLKAVVSQRLMPRIDAQGRVPAVEVLIATPYIRECILDQDKTHLIPGAIAQSTSQYGMQTFDQSIFSLLEQQLVSYEDALRWCSNVDEFKLKVQGISTMSNSTRDEMARSAQEAAAPKTPAADSNKPTITRFGK